MSRPLCAVIVGFGLTAASVSAQYTSVSAPSGGELGHSQILALALGGSFNTVGARNFSNGSILADRIRDKGSDNDQVWAAGRYNAVTMVASEASYSHTFGYVAGSSGGLGGFQGLLDSDNIGSQTSLTIGSDFRWAIKNDASDGGHLFTSRSNDNYNKKDHMVSYALYTETGKLFGYALFFEDKKQNSDWDYNDVAVLLTLVPTPQAASIGALGLLGVLGASRRRRQTVA